MKTYRITVSTDLSSHRTVECKPERLAVECLEIIKEQFPASTVELRNTDPHPDGSFGMWFYAWDCNDDVDIYVSCNPYKDSYDLAVCFGSNERLDQPHTEAEHGSSHRIEYFASLDERHGYIRALSDHAGYLENESSTEPHAIQSVHEHGYVVLNTRLRCSCSTVYYMC